MTGTDIEAPGGIEPPLDRVRLTATQVLGPGASMSGTQLAELGAIASAMGYEKAAVVALMNMLQSITMKAHLESVAKVMEQVADLHRARINRLMQEIRGLPEAMPPASGFLARLAPQQPLVSLVGREDVLRILARAENELPRV